MSRRRHRLYGIPAKSLTWLLKIILQSIMSICSDMPISAVTKLDGKAVPRYANRL